MKTLVAILGLVSLGGLTQAESTTPFSAVPPAVVFSASTVPEIAGVKASCEVVQVGEEWRIVTMVVNGTSRQAKFKLVLVMEPGIPADRYLVPGFNYNGNEYGKNMPQGWEKDGEPWIFSGDRASIPACTVSENKTDVFGLYASDADPASITSACSMEKRKDGSFRTASTLISPRRRSPARAP